jgi:hypothetical protein
MPAAKRQSKNLSLRRRRLIFGFPFRGKPKAEILLIL